MDVVQGVHDALGLDASQRPAAQGQVEPPPLDVKRGRVVNSETNARPRLWRERLRCGAYALAVGVERIDLRSVLGGEAGQPPLTAADLQHTLATQIDDRGDRGRLGALRIAHSHTADDTLPFALV